jgi:hypothetical protein
MDGKVGLTATGSNPNFALPISGSTSSQQNQASGLLDRTN